MVAACQQTGVIDIDEVRDGEGWSLSAAYVFQLVSESRVMAV